MSTLSCPEDIKCRSVPWQCFSHVPKIGRHRMSCLNSQLFVHSQSHVEIISHNERFWVVNSLTVTNSRQEPVAPATRMPWQRKGQRTGNTPSCDSSFPSMAFVACRLPSQQEVLNSHVKLLKKNHTNSFAVHVQKVKQRFFSVVFSPPPLSKHTKIGSGVFVSSTTPSKRTRTFPGYTNC